MTSSPGQAAACARYEQQRTPLFTLGTVLITPGALDMLEALQLAPLPFVLRHVAGDWGDLCQEDKEANAAALTYGTRAGAGVSGVSVATSIKAAVLAARLRRCEPPPSQTFFRGRMSHRTACATVLPACRTIPADPQSATSMCSFGRPRGPRPEQSAAHPVRPRSARAGPAAVRTALPCPVASSSAPTTVTP